MIVGQLLHYGMRLQHFSSLFNNKKTSSNLNWSEAKVLRSCELITSACCKKIKNSNKPDIRMKGRSRNLRPSYLGWTCYSGRLRCIWTNALMSPKCVFRLNNWCSCLNSTVRCCRIPNWFQWQRPDLRSPIKFSRWLILLSMTTNAPLLSSTPGLQWKKWTSHRP